ncbi:MAG: alpha/beta hydrolase family protein, partial [Bacteroidales bacterium]
RDFLNEPVVSDEIFSVLLNQYRYDKEDLKPQIEETIEEGEYIRQKITFNAAYGIERMMAYLFLPKAGTAPYQTVVYFPGSEVILMESSQKVTVEEMFIKSGRAVIYPIYKGTYERGDELVSDIPEETIFYKEHVIMWMKDLSRSVDYLETRDDIDTTRLAYFGGSWGGAMGAIVPAVEKRIKTSILEIAGLHFRHTLPEVEALNYLPRIKSPVLMLNGRYDFFFPYETSQLPFYELLGTSEKDKQLIVYEQSHNVPGTQLTKETLAWLDKYLGPVNSP